MKTLKVGIASAEDMIARTKAIARGTLKPRADDPKIWFTSPESFAKVLFEQANRALLDVIAATHRSRSRNSRCAPVADPETSPARSGPWSDTASYR